MIRFIVPQGIGDISWLFSKIDDFSKHHEIKMAIANDTLKRSCYFIDMHPTISFDGYTSHSYSDVNSNKISENTDLNSLEDGKTYFLSANEWLEKGNNLNEFLPKEKINYHYNLCFREQSVERANSLLNSDLRIGIYGSCYSMLRAWNFWKEHEWFGMVAKLVTEYPNACFYIIGAKFDIDLGDKLIELLKIQKVKYVRVIGESLETALWIIKNLDYLFAFPSGLGIMANVLKTPCIMFMPPMLKNMCHKFTPEQDNESGFFMNQLFINNMEAFKLFRQRGHIHMMKKFNDRIEKAAS